jgi:hypothetical protein
VDNGATAISYQTEIIVGGGEVAALIAVGSNSWRNLREKTTVSNICSAAQMPRLYESDIKIRMRAS